MVIRARVIVACKPGGRSHGTREGQVTAIQGARGSALHRRRWTWLPLAAVAPLGLIGCGDIEDASLCTAFAEYLAVRAEVRAAEPEHLLASDATDLAQDYVDAVDRLEDAADSRYTQQLDTLNQAARAVLLTLASVQDDADTDTWMPLIEDDLEDLENAAEVVIEAIEPSCATETSGT